MRYNDIPVKKSLEFKTVTRAVLYPTIPRSINDLYIVSVLGDRLDLLAYRYYNQSNYAWIIATANGIGLGSYAVDPGIQLRIPLDVDSILSLYKELNADLL